MLNRIINPIVPIIVMLTLHTGIGNAAGKNNQATAHRDETIDKCAFQNEMRRLWEDHIVWTRLYVISALENLQDKTATTNRLLQNQTDIGNAIKTFYGEAAGNSLTALLKDHILIAADLIGALKEGNAARSGEASNRWNTNADEIAAFLSSANPKHWPLAEMKSMMRGHLSATSAEVAARLKKDWEGDIRAYEEVHKQILHMADMLSNGIINQFPARFK
ncbi:MAG TPA: glycosyltransferase [Bacteroidota bacterium]|nr:glycosyltransferase [Bacteroidota bacterium]